MHASDQYGVDARAWQLAPFVLLCFSGAYAFWTIYVLGTGEATGAVTYAILASWFVALAVIYLAKSGYDAASLCGVPAIVTIIGLVEFIGVPTWRFISGDDLIDDNYIRALTITLIGYVAFWMGSWALMKKERLRFVPESPSTSTRVVLAALCMLIIGVFASVIEWRLGIYAYMGDIQGLDSAAALASWLNNCTQLLGGALLISGIEVLGKRKTTAVVRAIFYLSLGLMLGFGIISGMKSELLIPFLLVAAVYAMTRGRAPRFTWLIIPFLVLIVYPFVEAYRANLNAGYRAQVNTVDGLEATISKSFSDAFGGGLMDSSMVDTNVDSSTARLSLLSYVHDVISMPNMSLLQGDEKIYFAPLYPFIPRLLWPGKPVFDKGRRLSVALGRMATTSSAITPIGDLYSMYGGLGVVVGMLVYGIGAQLFMNRIGGSLSEKGVFFLFAVLPVLTDMERDVTSLIGAAVQSCMVFLFIAYAVYGGRLFSLRSDPVATPRTFAV